MTRETMIKAMAGLYTEYVYEITNDYADDKNVYDFLIKTEDIDYHYDGGLLRFLNAVQESENFELNEEYCLLEKGGGLVTSDDAYELLCLGNHVSEIADWLLEDDRYMKYRCMTKALEDLEKMEGEMEGVQLYRVVLVSCRVRRTVISGVTEEEAIRFCDDNNWEYAPDGGFVWDLEIEEDD